MNRERKRFEKWAKEVHLCTDTDLGWEEDRNCYCLFYVHFAWQAWRARSKMWWKIW